MLTASAIHISSVYKTYRGNASVLKGVGLSITKGEMVALIGASGSGKSTLIRAIAGLIPIDATNDGRPAGSIRLFGQPMQENGRIVHQQSTSARVLALFFNSSIWCRAFPCSSMFALDFWGKFQPGGERWLHLHAKKSNAPCKRLPAWASRLMR